jgi:hypothetical protein
MTSGLAMALVAVGSALVLVGAWSRWSRLIVLGLAAFGCAYAVWRAGDHGSDRALAAPLVGAGLLALGELAFYLADRATGTEYGVRQLARVALAALAALAVSGAVLLAATLAVRSSLALSLGGTLAALVAIALPSLRFRRRGDM